MAPPAKYRYVVPGPGGPFAFVEHPSLRGLWLRSHPCILVVDCPNCESKIGEPCYHKGYVSWTHATRRHTARGAQVAVGATAIVTVAG